MNLSMSTCATERRIVPGGFEFDPIEGIKQCTEAGFRYIDFNFAQAAGGGRPLSCDNWKDWIATIRQTVMDCGVTVGQTHGHWFHLNEMSTEEELQWHNEMTRRSIWGSAQLAEKPWVVVHPRSVFSNDEYDAEKSREYNYESCMRLGEYAAKYGTCLAVENLFANRNIGCCCSSEELMELMSRLNDPIFGICWDFGHANRAQVDQLRSLEMIAPKLRVTHCHDNKSRSDDHFIPYFGTVPWKEILPKLKQIGYVGNLNMEVHVTYNSMPQSLRMQALRFMRETGEDMIRYFEEA